jgi:hypothetical protein
VSLFEGAKVKAFQVGKDRYRDIAAGLWRLNKFFGGEAHET